MEIGDYIRLIRRRFWLILIAAAVGAGLSFINTSRQEPIYSTSATVMIGQYMDSANPNYAEIRTGMDLATTYVELLKTRPILEAASDELGLSIPPELMRLMVSARVVQSTSLIVITVTFTDPDLAADLANAVAHALVSQSPTNLTTEQQGQITFLNGQIEVLNVQVQDLRDRLAEISTQLGQATDIEMVTTLRDERNVALEQLNNATGNIAQFSSTIAALQQRVNSIQIVEEALPATTAIITGRTAPVLLYAVIAAAGMVVLLRVLEYFDDTVRTPELATQLLALPVLGTIVRFGTKTHTYKDMLLIRFPPMSSVNENYRSVRTNILHTIEKDSTGVLIVTSSNPQEGKTVTASNLAISMAMSGMRVILIDADLRRPKLHEAFSLENKIGLTTLLFADPTGIPEENEQYEDDTLEFKTLPKGFSQCVQPSGVDKLWVLTSGFIPSNPTELLASTAMARWIQTMRESTEIDLVIIDSPPVLVAADSTVLASNLNAQVVMVIDSTGTKTGAAKRAKAQFTQLGINVTGVIMNRANHRSDQYGYYYGYYYTPEEQEAPPTGLQRLLRRQPRSQ